MKKIAMLVTALALITGYASAQWNYSGNHIYNINSGYVGIGNNSPTALMDVAKTMTEPTVAVRNLGGFGGATFKMYDQNSGSEWKFKTTYTGGFKIRDNANGLDVVQIESNSEANALCIDANGFIGIGTNSPSSLLDVARNMTEPTITISNLGGFGGATIRMIDQSSNADWKFKTTTTSGLKIRDNANGLDVVQIESNSEANALCIDANGYIGIGTATPSATLEVARNMTEPTIAISNLGGFGGATFRMMDLSSGADWKFKTTNTAGFKLRDNTNGLDVIQIEPNSAANVLYIDADGYVGIGTTNPTEKLSINGNVKCKQVEVSLDGWSDFVFQDDYELMPLADLEAFILENNHLPDVPSEQEVLEKGTNLGEMDAILLQKIEELTLYVIELKKENEELKNLISQ